MAAQAPRCPNLGLFSPTIRYKIPHKDHNGREQFFIQIILTGRQKLAEHQAQPHQILKQPDDGRVDQQLYYAGLRQPALDRRVNKNPKVLRK